MARTIALLSMIVCMSSVMLGQAVEPRLEFEVASVKPAVFTDPAFAAGFAMGAGDCGGGTLTVSGNRVTLSPASICALIRIAYGVKGYQVFGMPSAPKISLRAALAGADTLPERFYEIQAQAGANAVTMDQARAMLRTLLGDRFQVKLHHEMKEIPVYALVTTKNKLKLLPSRPDCRPHPSIEIAISACDWSIGKFVDRLTEMGDRPVVDRTQLAGAYQFEMQRYGPDPLPSLFSVVEDLGLKLVAEKRPFDVLVVDHFEKPSAN